MMFGLLVPTLSLGEKILDSIIFSLQILILLASVNNCLDGVFIGFIKQLFRRRGD